LSPFKPTHAAPFGIRTAVWRLIRRGREFVRRLRARRDVRSAEATFCAEAPSNQTAVDIFKGTWTSALPPEYGVDAGTLASFEDVRVTWAAGVLPDGFRGLSILELGPYEGYAAWQFERLGAAAVTAVEASDRNYLKCLVVKEVAGLRARFLHGDGTAYLERCSERYDLVWASGVLYHSSDPLRLIAAIARVTDRVFLHSHYFVAGAAQSAHAESFFDSSRNRLARVGGRQITLHYKAYGQLKRGCFSGGAADYAYWLEKDDMFAALRAAGFTEIVVGNDDPGNPNGPALFCLARRA
jgi:SAM-dependent methyltransferase